LEITWLSKEDPTKQVDMSTDFQLVQDMSNQMISYERKVITSNYSTTESSSQAILRNHPTNSSYLNKPKVILSRDWYNFCDDNHDESTSYINKKSRVNLLPKY
jgi:hypothetical protein